MAKVGRTLGISLLALGQEGKRVDNGSGFLELWLSKSRKRSMYILCRSTGKHMCVWWGGAVGAFEYQGKETFREEVQWKGRKGTPSRGNSLRM